MRLIECYITGFGTLRDQSICFDRNLSVFFQDNGAGKSTLAAFLKAMLYSMPSYKANSKGFEDRRHYYPFDGGAYGGSLTLEHEGETYCINRRFDAKSETKDVLTITCQGVPTAKLGKEPGRTIFQVDRDSFERTAFFTADPGELGATSSIAGRLQSFLDNTEGPSDFAAAFDALDAAARDLQSTRGQNGKIARQQLLVRQLEQDLSSRNQLSDALEGHYAARQKLAGQIAAGQKALEENQAAEIEQERWQQYQGLQAKALRAHQKVTQLESLCGNPRPTGPQRERLLQCRNAMVEARASLSSVVFPQEKQRQLSLLQSRYPQGIPSQAVLDQAERLQQALDNPPPQPQPPGNGGILLMLVGLVLALGGIVTGFFSLIAGIAVAAVGLVLAATGWWMHSKAKSAYTQHIRRWEAEQEEIYQKLEKILAPYGLDSFSPELRIHGFNLENLGCEQAAALEKQQSLQHTLDSAAAEVAAIFASCRLPLSRNPEGDIDALCKNLEALEPRIADAKQAEDDAQSYRLAHNLNGQPPAMTADPLALGRMLEQLRDQLVRQEREIAAAEHSLEDLADCHIRLEEATEQEAALCQRHRLLTAARDCLAEAEAALKAKHIDPVRSRFDFYADALEQALGARLALDKNFGLYLQEKGGQYPDRHLSAGQRAVVALCLRLSLLDNLYPGSKPPIILDDPFVFLDGTHLEKARALVKSLSQQWQILYFTCHESRTM